MSVEETWPTFHAKYVHVIGWQYIPTQSGCSSKPASQCMDR